MSKQVYDVDYFLNYFQGIPDDQWCCGAFIRDHQRCAEGHCFGEDNRHPALLETFGVQYGTPSTSWPRAVNDGVNPSYQQATPKQRILAALRDIKAEQGAK